MRGFRSHLHFGLICGAVFNAVVSAVNLNVTAIGAKDGKSRFECWQLAAPFESSDQLGISGTHYSFLGDLANLTYNVIPYGYESGFHVVPANQYVPRTPYFSIRPF